MATLSSRLVISLDDRASGPIKGVVKSLRDLHAAAVSRPLQTMSNQLRDTGNHLRRAAGSATAAGLGLYGFIQATREFTESKFGYGVAQIPEYMRDGKFNAAGLANEMDGAARKARALAREMGVMPDASMKALEEVQKLGFGGGEGESVWRAALGLSMADRELASGEAVKFLGTVYRAYEKQRNALATRLGVSADDPLFVDQWIKGMAAKAAVAAAESSLSPKDLIEGLRQYAPQWAQFGMSPEYAMAALAHGANYGFRAPELGTAFKSMANRAIKPTAEGMRWLNALGIDRTKYMNTEAADPDRATNQLSSLLGGSLKKNDKSAVRKMLMDAQRAGTTSSPEFQEKLSNWIMRRLGRGWEGKNEEVADAVANATLSSAGQINLDGLIRDLIAKKAGPAALMAIFEGRHYARGTPMFEFYEKMYTLFEKLKNVDDKSLDAVVTARKSSEAGSTVALIAAWQELMLVLQDTGVIEGVKNALTGFADALRGADPAIVKLGAEMLVFAAAAAPVGAAIAAVGAGLGTMYAAVVGLGGLLARFGFGAGAAAAAGGTAATGAGVAGAGALAAATAANTAGKASGLLGTAGRLGGRLLPGLGILFAAYGAWEAYQAYKKTGSLGDAGLAFLGIDTATAAPAGAAAPGANSGPGEVEAETQRVAAQVRSIISSIDLTAEGERMMRSLATGIRNGGQDVARAVNEAVGMQVRSAVRESFSDGGLR